MSQFTSLLKEINSKLDVPHPAKSRILLEISADMDDLYSTYLEQGKSEVEAQRLTEEMFQMDEHAIRELASVHQPLFRKWMDKFSAHTQTTWERASLIFVLLFIAVFAGQAISTSQFFQTASAFVYPILGIGLLSIVVSIRKFYSLFLRKDHDLSTLHSGVTPIVVLGAANFFIGAWGYLIEIYSHGGGIALPAGSLINVIITVDPSQAQMDGLAGCFIRSASVVLAALFIASLIALLWFMLVSKISQIEQSEAEYLLTH